MSSNQTQGWAKKKRNRASLLIEYVYSKQNLIEQANTFPASKIPSATGVDSAMATFRLYDWTPSAFASKAPYILVSILILENEQCVHTHVND